MGSRLELESGLRVVGGRELSLGLGGEVVAVGVRRRGGRGVDWRRLRMGESGMSLASAFASSASAFASTSASG